jgi:hypothetical protein
VEFFMEPNFYLASAATEVNRSIFADGCQKRSFADLAL